MCATHEQGLAKGKWVAFADCQREGAAALTHPRGFEYFCSAHLPKAIEFSQLATEEAIAQLLGVKDPNSNTPAAEQAPTGLKRVIQWLKP